MTTPSTALSEAQKRMVVITTEAGDPVKYGNNPAELSGARYEMDLCLERLGAYELLIKHNAAAPLGNNMIATEDLDTIPFVTDMLADPNVANYTYRNPCPDTPTRIAATNVARAAAGEAPFTGVPCDIISTHSTCAAGGARPEDVAHLDGRRRIARAARGQGAARRRCPVGGVAWGATLGRARGQSGHRAAAAEA